ncbi:membrane protein [Kineosporia mesophila]|uniref:Membrane protein n=1 Tax=Kineosporia mesophila TaxID=566012 RepID=A0ABP6Z431_9ACTN
MRPRATHLSKVPEATALFWTIKICTTGMGEAASDFMGTRPVLVAAVLVALSGTALVWLLLRQFRADRYVPWIYWGTVAMISVFGTVAADGLRTALGLSYGATTIAFALAVAVSLSAWYRSERTLSIHDITTRRREIFYWVTVVATFALGTAAGDLTAHSLGLGYLDSGLLFLAVIAVPYLLHRGSDGRALNATAAFWAAYIVTRPLGASFADWAAVPRHDGGLHLGTGPVTLVLLIVIAALVRQESRQPQAGAIPVTEGAR